MSGEQVPMTGPVTLVDEATFARSWQPELGDAKAQVIEFELRGSGDQAEFMARANDGLGLSGDGRVRKWGGLQDRVWEALGQGDGATAVVVLRNVDDLVERALGVLLTALQVLAELRAQVGSEGSNFPRPLDLRVVLTGTGPSFAATPA